MKRTAPRPRDKRGLRSGDTGAGMRTIPPFSKEGAAELPWVVRPHFETFTDNPLKASRPLSCSRPLSFRLLSPFGKGDLGTFS